MVLFDRLLKKITSLFLLIGIFTLTLTSVGAAQGIARAGLLEDMQIRPNVRVEIPIEIENVVDLYGIDIELEFDPTFWEFEDADDRREGIQPAIGTFLDPGMTLFNIIDMEEGRIHLVMSQVNPSEAKSGTGNILVLYATALKTGVTQFEVTKVELSTRDGIGIEVEGVDGEVSIESEAPAVTTTPIPVVDPTQIIIIPTYVPPTATPVPTATPRPTATAVAVVGGQAGGDTEQAAGDTEQAADVAQTPISGAGETSEVTSAMEEPTLDPASGEGSESVPAAEENDPARNGQNEELAREGENDGKTGLWIGGIILAVALAAAGYFLFIKNQRSDEKEE